MTGLTCAIKRVGFCALRLPPTTFPKVGESLKTFEQAPSYDREEMNAVTWS